MRLMFLIVLTFGAIIIVGSTVGASYFFMVSGDIINNEIKYQLIETVAKNKANWVNTYIMERKHDIISVAISNSVKKSLNEKLVADSEEAKREIKRKAIGVARDLDEYIRNHPDLTEEDLVTDSAFGAIAVQLVGETGYTAVTNYDTLVNTHHTNPAIVGMDLSMLADKLPGFWSIMGPTKGGYESEGFYDWEEADGSITKKYMYIALLDEKTADGVGLHVAATTYLDEYESSIKMLKEAEDYLKEFKDVYGYTEMFLISSEARIWWSATGTSPFTGADLRSSENRGTLIAKIFEEARSSGQIIISDYFICEITRKPSLFIASPVSDDFGEFLGVVALVVNSDEIDRIMQESTGLGITGESYLVGSDLLMRSNSRFSDTDTILKQEVSTTNVKQCMIHQTEGMYETPFHGEIELYMGYRGKDVWGTHVGIPILGWCLIAEIGTDDVLVVYREQMMVTIIVAIAVFLVVGSLLSLWATRKITQPIEDMTKKVDQISKGNLNVKLEKKGPAEIQRLTESLERVLASMKLAVLRRHQTRKPIARPATEEDAVSEITANKEPKKAAPEKKPAIHKKTPNAEKTVPEKTKAAKKTNEKMPKPAPKKTAKK